MDPHLYVVDLPIKHSVYQRVFNPITPRVAQWLACGQWRWSSGSSPHCFAGRLRSPGESTDTLYRILLGFYWGCIGHMDIQWQMMLGNVGDVHINMCIYIYHIYIFIYLFILGIHRHTLLIIWFNWKFSGKWECTTEDKGIRDIYIYTNLNRGYGMIWRYIGNIMRITTSSPRQQLFLWERSRAIPSCRPGNWMQLDHLGAALINGTIHAHFCCCETHSENSEDPIVGLHFHERLEI